MNSSLITPSWPAPITIKSCHTLRYGGVSLAPFAEFNLALHVGDQPEHVMINRSLLKKLAGLPTEPTWLQQIHSNKVVCASANNTDQPADAAFTLEPNQVCAVLTADCLPIFLCNRQGTFVAAIHAGWRGLANGIIQQTLQQAKNFNKKDILAWLGPAISQKNYEVGEEVRQTFINIYSEAKSAFIPSNNKKWLADLYALARLQLNKLGVEAIFGGEYCTFSDQKRFYSYRRDGNQTGRMASLIWISDSR